MNRANLTMSAVVRKGLCLGLLLIFPLISGCRGKTSETPAPSASAEPAAADEVSEPPETVSPDAPNPEDTVKERAAEIVGRMDDTALTGQVLIAGLDGRERLSGTMRRLLEENQPGAVMLFSYNLDTDKDTVRSLLAECSRVVSEASAAPFIAVDHEGGEVHRFGGYVRKLPSALSFWYRTQAVGWERALEELEHQAFLSAAEIHGIGITMNFAPIAEILTPENAAFLGTRSFGPNGLFVEKACAAFIRGMERAGVACVIKHFPGDTAADPHSAKPVLNIDAQTLDNMTEPFHRLITGMNPAAVMVSHVVVSAWDPERNASLSPAATARLRGWGFEGIAVADDFSMGAVAGLTPEEAAVQALNAGIDMVMAWPRGIASTRRAIARALQNGSIERGRLVEAATRIVTQKLRHGVIE